MRSRRPFYSCLFDPASPRHALCHRLGSMRSCRPFYSCRLDPRSHQALQSHGKSDTCGIRTHAGRPHRLSRPTPWPLGQSVHGEVKSGILGAKSTRHAGLLLAHVYLRFDSASSTVWPSGLRRWLQAPVRKGVGSNPTAVIL